MQITQLRTEYRKNPVGIDNHKPRLSWKLESEHSNMMQSSYQILAYSAESGTHQIWDSGVVEDSASQRVLWEGPELGSMERVYWKVRVLIAKLSEPTLCRLF